jgi:hypothetical protein
MAIVGMKVVMVAALATLSVGFVLAQQKDVAGSKDHQLISRYPGSVITDYSVTAFDEYTLPLGNCSKTNGPRASTWRAS